jgi:Trk K+ transport system NAD-binding subunit
LHDIIWLTMRRMRLPLILLLIVYFGSVFILVSVPAVDDAGRAVRISYLDAAYFVTIMATTIGFGEIPYTFTAPQRMLVLAIILPNVVAWLSSIGAILGLFLDPEFRSVLRRTRFARSIRWIGEPFHIVCGCGNTGSLVVKGLLRRGLHAAVLETNVETVHRLHLDDEFAHVPALASPTSEREYLELAGLHHENCVGVIAATNDDHANLQIAITVKLLRPDLPMIARSETQRVSDNMISFGTDAVVNPYAIFAERLVLALSSPIKYLVQDWLISVEGSHLRERLDPPIGRWIICGAGRLGERLLDELTETGLPVTVVDVHEERLGKYASSVLGRGTEAHTLKEAGIEDAVGIIASTGDDIDNLSIVMTARELNPDLFLVARQEKPSNDALFDAANVDLVAKRSLIVARRILAVVTTPMLPMFLQELVKRDDQFATRLHARLKAVLHGRAPSIWDVELSGDAAAGLRLAGQNNISLRLRHLTHNARSVDGEKLDCVCLMLQRGAQRIFLPEGELELIENDRLLFAGRGPARREMFWGLTDENALVGSITGRQLPRGAIWRWLWRRRQAG